MKRYEAYPVLSRRFILGEGPCYDLAHGVLSWVDIKMGTLFQLDAEMNLRETQVGQYLGAAIPTMQGHYVALMTTGVYLMNDTELLRKIYAPEGLLLHQRFNDAKCDPKGRLWAGTMSLFPGKPWEGKLYRFIGMKSQTIALTDMGTPNGMAWSADGKTMYFIDTATRSVDAFDYNPELGNITRRRQIIRLEEGFPDGMTIDAEGMLWVAVWGIGEVRRYDPRSGQCLSSICVPAPNVTSCCFGGIDLQTLYITTSAEHMENVPLAGCVFAVKCDVQGTETVKFNEELNPEGGVDP